MKKIGYINATKGTLFALIIFVVAIFIIPSAGPSHQVELILTVSTFLFAILLKSLALKLMLYFLQLLCCPKFQ